MFLGEQDIEVHPFKLRYVSTVRVNHVLSHHPKINRGFLSHMETYLEVLKCLNQTPKSPRTSTFEYKEHLKRNHSNNFSRSQSSLESSSNPLETPRYYKIVKLYIFKPLKSRNTSTTNLQI